MIANYVNYILKYYSKNGTMKVKVFSCKHFLILLFDEKILFFKRTYFEIDFMRCNVSTLSRRRCVMPIKMFFSNFLILSIKFLLGLTAPSLNSP